MFGSEFNSGSLDGRFELAETNMTNVALAPNTPTRVLAYGSHLTANQLCSNLELLALSADSDIKCSGCVDRPEDEMPACMLAVTEDMLLDNYCPAWKELDQLPQCAEDLPANPHRVR
jgi:hypothetical protein